MILYGQLSRVSALARVLAATLQVHMKLSRVVGGGGMALPSMSIRRKLALLMHSRLSTLAQWRFHVGLLIVCC